MYSHGSVVRVRFAEFSSIKTATKAAKNTTQRRRVLTKASRKVGSNK